MIIIYVQYTLALSTVTCSDLQGHHFASPFLSFSLAFWKTFSTADRIQNVCFFSFLEFGHERTFCQQIGPASDVIGCQPIRERPVDQSDNVLTANQSADAAVSNSANQNASFKNASFRPTNHLLLSLASCCCRHFL